MKHTSYFCDFTGVVTRHLAGYSISVVGTTDTLPAHSEETCSRHLTKVLGDLQRKGYTEFRVVVHNANS